MKKRNETIRMLVLSAMFAALCCVTTMLVQFPTVAGYTNIGEGMCLLAGLVLGPWYGFFAAGIGSGLADLLAGYAHYVPGTFIIKGLVALVAALLLRPLLKKGEKIPFWRLALIELPSEVIMVAGYFGYKALILGKGLAAAASIPNNLVQAAVGIVLSVVLYTALAKVPEIHKAFCRQSVFSNLRSDFAHSLIDKVQNSSVISRNRGLYNRLSSLFVDIELNGFYFQKSSNGIIRSFAPEIAAEQFRFFHGFFECTYDFCRDASHYTAGGDVLCNDGASRDDRIFTNGHTVHDRTSPPHENITMDFYFAVLTIKAVGAGGPVEYAACHAVGD